MLLTYLEGLVLLVPLVFVLPRFVRGGMFTMFLTRPVDSVLTTVVAASAFFDQFGGVLSEGWDVVGESYSGCTVGRVH